MKEILSRLFTAPDNMLDDARVCAAALVFAFIFLSAYSVVVQHVHFDMQQFGIGAGAIAAGVGGWFGFRKGN